MDNLSLSVNMILVGLTVVFMSLVLLSYSIVLLSKMLGVKKVKKAESVSAAADEASILEIDENEDLGAPVNHNFDDELVAIITAAIQANLGSRTDTKIMIKSFKRVPQNSPVWNVTGRGEQLAGKL